MRGGISVALVLSIPESDAKPAILAATYAVVLFTIIVQGSTLGMVARRTLREALRAAATAATARALPGQVPSARRGGTLHRTSRIPLMVFTVLLVLIPISAALKYLVGASPLLVFASSALAIAVLAEWVRRATDQLADRVGPAIGGLLTVSFGSIAELVLALFVLLRGEVGRVASLDIRRGRASAVLLSRFVRLGEPKADPE